MNDSGLSKNIRDSDNKDIDKTHVRFVLLIIAGVIGVELLGNLFDVKFFCDRGLHETVAEHLATAVVGIPVFISLWCFRTRDVRQQIEQVQEQIEKAQKQIEKAQEQLEKTQEQTDEAQRQNWQNQLHVAIENLSANDNFLKEIAGAKSLRKLSKITPEFDELITFAFAGKKIQLGEGGDNEERKKMRDEVLSKMMADWVEEKEKRDQEKKS